MSLVVDCSVALAWYLPDENSETAGFVLDRVVEDGAVVPYLFSAEFANGLLMAERRKRISADFRRLAFTELANLQLVHDFDGHDKIRSTCAGLAERHELTVYDATYLELAARARLPLATFDKALVRAAKTSGVELIGATP